jgi:3-oxoacyl-[acyl-carrier protein] reductase
VRYLVTGTSRGVGQALAAGLVARGDQVVGCSRSGSSLADPHYVDLALDVTNAPAVAEAFAGLRQQNMLPDVVVLCAGVTSASPALFQSADDFEEVLATNVGGAFFVAREALRAMMRSGFGRIIFLSSINTRLHSAGGVAYNASKAAVEEMGRTLARECPVGDVTVNTLGLSLVEGAGMAADLTDEETRRKAVQLPRPDPISVPAVLHAIDFLAAPEAAAITGQTIFFGGVA